MNINFGDLQTSVWIYDLDHHCMVWANDAALTFWNSPSLEEFQQRDLNTGLSEAVRESLMEFKLAFEQGQVIQENWFFTPHDTERQAFCQFSGYRLEDGRMAMLVEAMPSPTNYHELQPMTSAVISSYTLSGKLISANPPFYKSFSNSVNDVNQLFIDETQFAQLLDIISQNSRFEDDLLLRTPRGERWFRVTAHITNFEHRQETLHLHKYDIDERKSNEKSLEKQAVSDHLTNLLNRRGIIQTLQNNLENNIEFSLLYIDLDGFKIVNDSSGHATGDLILKEVARRLVATVIPGSSICRFGGDEFLVVLYHNEQMQSCLPLLDELIVTISQPYQIPNKPIFRLSASIGVSHYPDDSQDGELLIAYADAAMYKAKMLGKKRWVKYQKGMEQQLKRQSDISIQLISAEKKNELSLYYQPIVDMASGRIISFEALLRWHNASLGFVNTEEMIKVAEETGLITDIENWVLNRAIQDLVKLKMIVDDRITMAVNLSGSHMVEAHLAHYILSLLEDNGLQPEDLTIELTESVLLLDLGLEDSPARELTKKGIKLNIDDFGTGYSSLAYLHDIPASVVKVDRAFLHNADSNTKTLKYIEKLITSLGMQSLIEGIESEYQSNLLAKIGFQLQQGYFHGRPQPMEYYISEKFATPDEPFSPKE